MKSILIGLFVFTISTLSLASSDRCYSFEGSKWPKTFGYASVDPTLYEGALPIEKVCFRAGSEFDNMKYFEVFFFGLKGSKNVLITYLQSEVKSCFESCPPEHHNVLAGGIYTEEGYKVGLVKKNEMQMELSSDGGKNLLLIRNGDAMPESFPIRPTL